MEMETYKFSCFKGQDISNDSGYKTIESAISAVKEWQSLGWHIDYITDNNDKVHRVIDANAMNNAS